jgi:hypothetical protein
MQVSEDVHALAMDTYQPDQGNLPLTTGYENKGINAMNA